METLAAWRRSSAVTKNKIPNMEMIPHGTRPREGSPYPRTGYNSYSDYSFDVPEDLVPGLWTFELWDENRKLIEQKFTVVKQ